MGYPIEWNMKGWHLGKVEILECVCYSWVWGGVISWNFIFTYWWSNAIDGQVLLMVKHWLSNGAMVKQSDVQMVQMVKCSNGQTVQWSNSAMVKQCNSHIPMVKCQWSNGPMIASAGSTCDEGPKGPIVYSAPLNCVTLTT